MRNCSTASGSPPRKPRMRSLSSCREYETMVGHSMEHVVCGVVLVDTLYYEGQARVRGIGLCRQKLCCMCCMAHAVCAVTRFFWPHSAQLPSCRPIVRLRGVARGCASVPQCRVCSGPVLWACFGQRSCPRPDLGG